MILEDLILAVLVWLIFVVAIYRLSPVAFVYASLIYLHDYYFGYLNTEEYFYIYTALAGGFSITSMFVCYHFRKNVNDNIAWWLYNISVLALFVNILTLYMAANSLDMKSLFPVFAAVNILSIIFIARGDNGHRHRNMDLYSFIRYIRSVANTRGVGRNGLAQREKRT